jgi:hypothetical protein
MTKKFVTVVTTEWEIHHDLPIDRINAHLRSILGHFMMTPVDENGAWAVSKREHMLELETKEADSDDQKLTDDQKTELWGMLEDQAAIMSIEDLRQYFADSESEKYTLAMYNDLKSMLNPTEEDDMERARR